MIVPLDVRTVAQALAEGMVHSVVVGTMLAVCAGIVLRASRRQNSGTRFAIWFSVLMGIAALLWLGSAQTLSSAAESRAVVGEVITLPRSWTLYLFGAWAAVASVALARVGFGLWQLHEVRLSCSEVDGAMLEPALRETLLAFQRVRRVRLCTSDRVQAPTALGLVRPIVALPAWAIEELSASELRAVVLHELAHLRRWDDWTNLAQKLAQALLFFHPVVWWIESRLSLEREMACDDAVLRENPNPHAYAECLVSVAEKSFLRRGLALAQAVVGRMRQMSARITQILDARRPGATGVWKPAAGIVGLLSVACLVWSPRAPRLVGFEESHRTAVVANVAGNNVVSGSGEGRMLVSGAAPSGPSAHVVPAMSKNPAVTGPARAARTTKVPSIKTGIKKTPGAQEAVLRAATKANEGVPQAEAVFVVFQGQQVDAYGSVVWNVRVVYFTVYSPSTHAVDQTVSRKT